MDRAWLLGLLGGLRHVAGSDLALSKLLGLRHSGHIPDLLSGKIVPSPTTCLMIARAAKVHPTLVLQAAGHADLVAVAEAAYAPTSGTATSIEGFTALPWLAAPIAAGKPLILESDPESDRALAFQDTFLRRFTRPICLTVGRRELSMTPTILPGDVVLVDQNPEIRQTPRNGRIYAVAFAALTGDPGGAVKRIELRDNRLIISSDNPDKDNYPTEVFDIEDRSLLDILKGEVVWFGRTISERRASR